MIKNNIELISVYQIEIMWNIMWTEKEGILGGQK
jgi:hypothetical protein